MNSLFSAPFGRQGTGFIGIMAALCLSVHLATGWRTVPVEFNNLRELENLAAANGFFLHGGMKSGRDPDSFYVADHTVDGNEFREITMFMKRACGLTPGWRGIVWVSKIRSQGRTLYPDSIGGNTRVWGNLVVAGDKMLMDRIEGLYRSK